MIYIIISLSIYVVILYGYSQLLFATKNFKKSFSFEYVPCIFSFICLCLSCYIYIFFDCYHYLILVYIIINFVFWFILSLIFTLIFQYTNPL